MSAETDDRLVSLSAEGSEEAAAILIVRYFPVVSRIAARFYAAGIEHEDFVQEGMIGFLNAVRTFRSDRGCSFNTYARICVISRMKKTVAFANTAQYSLLSQAVALDEAQRRPTDLSSDPERLLLDQEAIGWFSGEIGKLLSENERQIFLSYLEGYEPSEIARERGVTPRFVYNALGRARKKLRRAFESGQNN